MKFLNTSQNSMAALVFSGALMTPMALNAQSDAAKADAVKGVLIAQLLPTEGSKTRGAVVFVQSGENEVTMATRIFGLKPGMKHAIHIHEFGDLSSADGKSAGGHYNPAGHPHGLPPAEERHAGDLGNLTADAEGNTVEVKVIKGITLNGESNPILGRALVVHEGEDKGTQPTGDAGARIAAGVIGFANPDSLHKSDDPVAEPEKSIGERVGDDVEKALEKAGPAIEKAADKTKSGIEKALREVEKAVDEVVD